MDKAGFSKAMTDCDPGKPPGHSVPAAFLDRDGTLNAVLYRDHHREWGPPWSPDEVRLLPGAVEGLRLLRESGFLLFVVTNQPDAAKGKANNEQLDAVKQRFLELLAEHDVAIDGYQDCRHHPGGQPGHDLAVSCACRKPEIGMLEKCVASQTRIVDLTRSVMIGDRQSDMLCAQNYSIPFVGIKSKSSDFLVSPKMFSDFLDCARYIVDDKYILQQ